MIQKTLPFFDDIRRILIQARQKAYAAVNFTMVEAYWLVGKRIVQEEQQGRLRAEYGKHLLIELSAKLAAEFGSGYSPQSLRNMRQFYFLFGKCSALRSISNHPAKKGLELREKKCSALRRELAWTHYKALIRVENEKARLWYMNEAADQNWSTRALERQINSLYYDRLLMSRDKAPVIDEMRKNIKPLAAAPEDFIKDPYVLEFLAIPDQHKFRESELEQAIIEKLRDFILELGKGFAFVARQQRISTETSEFYIDLVFYNYILKCFVLIDLKTGRLTHQDIGQIDMYVRLYEDTRKGTGDNPTIGIILCTEKDHTVAKYSVLSENRRLFASKYLLYLPTEEELAREIEREKALLHQEITAVKKGDIKNGISRRATPAKKKTAKNKKSH